ncbi:hypothetical protein DFJ74DRAFT_690729 [Hyaloraphidium curvatum]|nr:hypothetical protein DFJ74DRAFT_690729 [Hyaloraphidium curvatum]
MDKRTVCLRTFPMRSARGTRTAVGLFLALGLLASFPRPARPSSYSGPPSWSYNNLTDLATGRLGCAKKPTTHCCCGTPCGSSYSVCPEPCGSAGSSVGFPYACGVADNGLPASQSRYYVNLVLEGVPGRCTLRQQEWLAVESPMVRGGTWGNTQCEVKADCPWAELGTAYGDALNLTKEEVWAGSGQDNATVGRIALRPTTGAGIDSISLWCPVAMGCPGFLFGLATEGVAAPSRVPDPSGTEYAFLPSANVLVKVDSKGDVGCLASSWGDRSCLQLTTACYMFLNKTRIGGRGLPYLSCADIPAADRTAPDHFCTRGRELLDRLKPPQVGPGARLLGLNCTYAGAPDPSVDPTGAGPWTVASVAVARRHDDGSVSVLTGPEGMMQFGLEPPWCAANAAATAPSRAASAKIGFGSHMSNFGYILAALAEERDKGEWMCIEGCPGSGEYFRGRRFFNYAAIEQLPGGGIYGVPYPYGSPRIYSDSACSAANQSSDMSKDLYMCRPGASTTVVQDQDRRNPWDPWCVRMLGAVFDPHAEGCATTAGPNAPKEACVASPADKGNRVRVQPVNVTLQDGTTVAVPRCQGPDGTRCTWFADKDCTFLAKDEPSPEYLTTGYVCGRDEGGWCRLAAEALRLVPSSTTTVPPEATTALPATTMVPPATSSSTLTPAAPTSTTTVPPATPSGTSVATYTPRPWICVRSCADRGNAVLVRISADGGHAQCKGPDGLRCSWFLGSSSCGVLAPGEPSPDPSGETGKTCTAEEEGAAGSWCNAARAALSGGAVRAQCSTGTILASGVASGRRAARWGVNAAAFAVRFLLV